MTAVDTFAWKPLQTDSELTLRKYQTAAFSAAPSTLALYSDYHRNRILMVERIALSPSCLALQGLDHYYHLYLDLRRVTSVKENGRVRH
jgi:hypothetical protein